MADEAPIRVLHVDDEPGFGEMAATYLERSDDRLVVETATNPVEALNQVQDVDCVVSDYDMPGMDGIDFLEAARTKDADLPFILFTGKGSEEVASEAISAGVTDYLQKEGGTDQYAVLANRITNAVEHERSRERVERSERRLRDVIDTVPHLLYVLDADGTYRLANEALANFHQTTVDDIEGSTVTDVLDDSVAEGLMESVEAVLESGSARRFGWREVSDPDGRTHVFEPRLRPYEAVESDAPAVLGIAADVTDHAEHERAIEALHGTATEIMQSESDERVASVMVEAMETVLDMPLNGVFLRDGTEDTLRPVAVSDRNPELIGDVPTFHQGDSLAWDVYESGESQRFDDVSREARRHNPDTVIRSEMIVPLGDRGVAMVGSTEIAAFDEFDVSLVETLASHAETALDRIDREGDLERAQERYRTLLDHYPDGGVFLYDEELRCTLAGGQGLADAGLDPESVQGKRPRDRYPMDIADELETNLERAFDGESTAFEQTLGERTYRVQTAPIGANPVRRVMAVSQDVTESRRQEGQLAALHDVAADLASSDSMEAICERTIRASEEVLDFDLSVIRVERDGWLVPVATSEEIPHEGLARVAVDEGVVGRTYRRGESVVIHDAADHEFAGPPGSEGSGISIALGSHGTFQAIALEPHAFDEADLELAELLVSHTENALDRLERERELERQNERLDEFASVVSHDIRNPLATASGYLELARDECESEHLDGVADAHGRIETLIDDVLTMAREGHDIDGTEPVDFAGVAGECWENIAGADAALEVDAAGRVRASPNRLKRLLENLFRNAVEHGGEDVSVTLERTDGGFAVEDDGPGIPSEDWDAVFDAGFSTAPDGNGLGLGIVREIARAHGWDLRVAEGAPGGARFEITGVEWLD